MNDFVTTLGIVLADSSAAATAARLVESIGVPTRQYADANAWIAKHGNGAAASEQEEALLVVGGLGEMIYSRFIEQALQAQTDLPVIAIAESPSTVDAVEAMKQGAYDVLALPDQAADLPRVIRQALSRGSEAAQRRQVISTLRHRLSQLTTAENQVLDAMLEGMANKQIAQALQIGLRTVELRRSKIMKKMEAKSLAELVKFVCQAKDTVEIPVVNQFAQLPRQGGMMS